ncbi:MAG: ATP-binding cassette domain-containing protein [Acidimicrobiales bacterium]
MNDLVVAATVRQGTFQLQVELRVGDGEIVGVVGDIGSGKSTALALVAGQLRAVGGTVTGPESVWDDPARGIWVPPVERELSYLAARPALIDDVAVIEQVMAAATRGDDSTRTNGAARALRERCLALLDEVGLAASVAERDGWTLSGGETQRALLVRAFVAGSPVVVLDDPFRALDTRSGLAVRRWLAERLHAEGQRVLLTCADPADTLHLADRTIPPGRP